MINQIFNEDSINFIKRLDTESIDLILSDIPYGINFDEWDVLHNNKNSALLGKSPSQIEKGAIFKTRGKPLNGWSKEDKKIPLEYYEWCMEWAQDWYRILKPGASCFVFAGRRLAHRCITALEDTGFIFKDMIAWQKETAAYRAQGVNKVFERREDFENMKRWEGWKIGNLRPLFEPILWFMKPYPIGGTLTDNIVKYNLGAFNSKQIEGKAYFDREIEMNSNILKVKTSLEDTGLHPTQKPLKLMELLIDLVTVENQIVLDPFMGSGTTVLAAKNLNRAYIGIEKEKKFYEIAKKRIENYHIGKLF